MALSAESDVDAGELAYVPCRLCVELDVEAALPAAPGEVPGELEGRQLAGGGRAGGAVRREP